MIKFQHSWTDWETRGAFRTYVFPPPGVADEPGCYFAHRLLTAMSLLPDRQRARFDLPRYEKLNLYRYLATTETIEIEVVNPALQMLMRDDIAPEVYCDASRVYADEGFHAAMCLSLRAAIESPEAVPFSHRYVPRPLREVFKIIDTGTSSDRATKRFFAAAINETLITENLRQANDETLKPSIRASIAAHAFDEAKHHYFFAQVMAIVWAKLDERERARIAPALPQLLVALLERDVEAIRDDLVECGVDRGAAEDVVTQSLAHMPVIDRLRCEARGSLAALRKAGVFSDAIAREAFADAGLAALIDDLA